MTKNKNFLGLAVGLAGIVAGLAAAVTQLPLYREVSQVMMMIIGMLIIAASSAISRYMDANGSAPLVQISFDEFRARQILDDAMMIKHVKHRLTNYDDVQSWEPTSDSLMAQDPALALAKLRIDLERELRKIAFDRNLIINLRSSSINKIMDVLVQKEIVANEIVITIKEVLSVCSKYIHGGDLNRETTIGVLSIGQDLLNFLKTPTYNDVSSNS